MSEQDATQPSIKQRMSRKTSAANQQNGKQAHSAQRPANDDPEGWKAYWKYQGQLWRTEPEIDLDRRIFLTERRSITPDIKQGIYPFKDIEPKLTRADIEWLLATHENESGPVDWSDAIQREREGLDLRGAYLGQVDLSNLPLTRLRGGLDGEDWDMATKTQTMKAAVIMRGADLHEIHLEGAILRKAQLEQTFLSKAHLEDADLCAAHLEGANLRQAHLEGAALEGAYLNVETILRDIFLGDVSHGFISLSDIRWGDVNLTLVKWSQMKMLGEEYKVRYKKLNGNLKGNVAQLDEYEKAVRANRQLSSALQTQGMNKVATRFTYRAQVLEMRVFWYQMINREAKFRERLQSFGALFFSCLLFLLAGYGYKPWRSFVAYLLVITVFAIAYFIIGHKVGPVLSPLGSFVFSMTSFHGRGFFPGGITLDDPLTVLAALEAFVGLLIEVTFIATLTQRLFSK